jgi:hypothetical protein
MPAAALATSTPQQPVLPRDARLIALILAAAGAEDCEEGVVRMLLEFAHRESHPPGTPHREGNRIDHVGWQVIRATS